MSRTATTLTLLALTATPALASRTIVPDQHATIQLGIDSGVDTVLVRPGEYPEVVTTDRDVVVMGMIPSFVSSGQTQSVAPTLGGFIATTPSTKVELHSMHLRGHARIESAMRSRVMGCRLDGGLRVGRFSSSDHVFNSMVFGDLDHFGSWGEIGMNTVVGGTIRVPYSTGGLLVHDNVVIGPAPVGIENHVDAYIRNNYVRGCDIGIRAACASLADIVGNIVEDCSEHGISFDHCVSEYPGNRNVDAVVGNVVRRAGGRGISVPGRQNTIADNVVEDCGAEGIFQSGAGDFLKGNRVLRSGGDGIRAGTQTFPTTDNIVLYSAGDGMRLDDANHLLRNIVGHSGGSGIAVDGINGYIRRIRSNTSYANNGAGFTVAAGQSLPDSITHNISYGNAVGLAWSGPSTPFLGCNDWFANTGAAVTGTSVGATDVALDPMFCDLPDDIVSLAAGSPLANLAGCGQVGALGVACAVAVGVGDTRPASLGRLRIQPQPSQGAMSFAFDASDAATTLEVYDVSGARRMTRTLAPRTAGYAWNGTDDAGQPLPAGVYFAKLVQSAARSEATVVVIR